MPQHGATTLLPLQLVALLSVVKVATSSQCDLASLCSDPSGCGGLLFAKVSDECGGRRQECCVLCSGIVRVYICTACHVQSRVFTLKLVPGMARADCIEEVLMCACLSSPHHSGSSAFGSS